MFLLFVSLFVACYSTASKTVRLPGGSEAPAVTDPSFVALIDSLISIGEGSAEFVCVLQYEDPEHPPRNEYMEPLENAGRDVWIIWATALAIEDYMHNPNLRFIGEYMPEYKYNRTLADAGITWVYVESFADNQPEFFDEMADLGIESIRYIGIPGLYYCKVTGDQVVELSYSWWVRRIYRAHRRVIMR